MYSSCHGETLETLELEGLIKVWQHESQSFHIQPSRQHQPAGIWSGPRERIALPQDGSGRLPVPPARLKRKLRTLRKFKHVPTLTLFLTLCNRFKRWVQQKLTLRIGAKTTELLMLGWLHISLCFIVPLDMSHIYIYNNNTRQYEVLSLWHCNHGSALHLFILGKVRDERKGHTIPLHDLRDKGFVLHGQQVSKDRTKLTNASILVNKGVVYIYIYFIHIHIYISYIYIYIYIYFIYIYISYIYIYIFHIYIYIIYIFFSYIYIYISYIYICIHHRHIIWFSETRSPYTIMQSYTSFALLYRTDILRLYSLYTPNILLITYSLYILHIDFYIVFIKSFMHFLHTTHVLPLYTLYTTLYIYILYI